jgi:hypothetical protein
MSEGGWSCLCSEIDFDMTGVEPCGLYWRDFFAAHCQIHVKRSRRGVVPAVLSLLQMSAAARLLTIIQFRTSVWLFCEQRKLKSFGFFGSFTV